MNEELILYGKNNPHVVPQLEVWGFPISLYLFLGGMAAGILFFTSLFYLLKKDKTMPVPYTRATYIAIAALIIGTIALLFDLHKILNTWRLYTHFDLQAPMSWGAWTLLAIIPLAILWGVPYKFSFINEYKWKNRFETNVAIFRKPIAVLLIITSVILGVYTGMLLSAFVARPLWNSNFLPILFLLSGLSSGIAVIIWLNRNSLERNIFRRIDIWLIIFELSLLIVYAIDLFSGSEAQVSAIRQLAGGEFAFLFWMMVIFVGLVIPAVFEWRELRGAKIPTYVAPVLILIGGLAFRMIIVQAGQLI